jgi:hypothetical protein
MAHWTASLSLVAIVLLAGCITTPEQGPPGDGADATDEPFERLPVEFGSLDEAFIRPGAPIGWCTYNFLFVDPDGESGNGTPTYYIGTAAHCVNDVGQEMPLAGEGTIGEVAFSTYNDTYVDDYGVRRGADFALVRLYPDMNLNAHPLMMNTAGPTGVATASDVALGDELEHHGYGMVFGDIEPARDRPGFLVTFEDDFCSQSAVWWGDSGSPVLHAETGMALGLVSRLGGLECNPTSHLAGATIIHVLEEMAKTPFDNVRLVLEDGSYTDRLDATE